MADRDPLVDTVVSETEVIIERWQPEFGDLITITMPETMTREKAREITQYIQDRWWPAHNSYFKGAKLLVLCGGIKIGIHTEEQLRHLGYVPADTMPPEEMTAQEPGQPVPAQG